MKTVFVREGGRGREEKHLTWELRLAASVSELLFRYYFCVYFVIILYFSAKFSHQKARKDWIHNFWYDVNEYSWESEKGEKIKIRHSR